MWPTCQAADTNVVCLLALVLQKKHIFVQLLGWPADWPTYVCSL